MVSVIFLSPLLCAVAAFLQNFLFGARKESLEGEEARLLSGMSELCSAINEECDSGLCKNNKDGDESEVFLFIRVPHNFLTVLDSFFRELSFAVTKGVPRTELISITEANRMVDMLSYSTAATRRYTNDEFVELVCSVTKTRGHMCLNMSKAFNKESRTYFYKYGFFVASWRRTGIG